jgi:hypothetical protein
MIRYKLILVLKVFGIRVGFNQAIYEFLGFGYPTDAVRRIDIGAALFRIP